MRVKRTDEGNATTLAVTGSLDAVTACDLRTEIDRLVADKRQEVTFDASALRIIDSSGVGVIISLWKRVQAQKGDFKIVGLRDQPRAVFRLLGLHRVFPIDCSPQADVPSVTRKTSETGPVRSPEPMFFRAGSSLLSPVVRVPTPVISLKDETSSFAVASTPPSRLSDSEGLPRLSRSQRRVVRELLAAIRRSADPRKLARMEKSNLRRRIGNALKSGNRRSQILLVLQNS